ncbi:MAG: TlpA family protein disulfide reductase [Nevskiales bacterium]
MFTGTIACKLAVMRRTACRGLVLSLSLLCALPVAALEIGQVAPDFSRPGLREDSVIALGDFRGKVVYVDFWAAWCEPCRQSMPALNKVRNSYRERGFEVLAVNLDMNREWAERFLREHPVDYPVVLDPEGEIPIAYGVEKMPSGFFVDRKGRVREIHQGFQPSHVARIRYVVETLLKEEP